MEFLYTRFILLLDVTIGFLIVLVFAIVVTAVAHIWLKVPYVPTPHKVVQEMIQLAHLSGTETVYDLGAGDGRLLVAAKKQFPNIQAIGLEAVPTIWLLGKITIWKSGTRVRFLCKNAFKKNVKDADVVFLYLLPNILKKLETKFDTELKKGTKVISYAFSFPNKKPIQEKNVPWLQGTRKLFLYEW